MTVPCAPCTCRCGRPPIRTTSRDQSVLYASHLDVRRDWTDVESIVDVLDKLQIAVPRTLYDELVEDQSLNRGNRLVRYPAPAAILSTP